MAHSETRKKVVTMHTDGACLGNPGPGGWACILEWGDQVREIVGGEPSTTNNRMELQAAISGLEAMKEPCQVDLHSDSQYLVKGMTEWMPTWLRRRFAKVKNPDLWRRLLDAAKRHEVHWYWVRGHAGHEENERCDELARNEATRQAGTH